MHAAPLKILIVEDTPSKKRKLLQRLASLPDLFEEPDLVVCTSEAVKRLKDKDYDLLLLDVVVPLKGHEDPGEQHSMDLLARIDSSVNGIRRPKHVLLMSASNPLSRSVSDFIKGRPWGCIHYQEDSTQSLDDIEQIARWILSQNLLSPQPSQCDVLLLTALEDPEFSALEAAIDGLETLSPLDASQLVRYGRITSHGRELRVAVAFAARMGPVASAVLATKAIDLLRPKFVLMTGICGAIAKKAEIGDLVAAESSWDWQSGKFTDAEDQDFELAPHHVNVDDAKVRTSLTLLKRDTAFWNEFMPEAMKLKLQVPKLVIGPMATGAAVVADAKITKKIREDQNKNVVGIDMETYAVYVAAKSAAYPLSFLSLKAVCDRADVGKNDNYQLFAARVSAVSAVHFLKSYASTFIPE
jgi:nucleoside phosphorylase